MIAYTWFNILEENYDTVIYECTLCGEVFTVDAYASNNLYWNSDELDYLPICPTCGTKAYS